MSDHTVIKPRPGAKFSPLKEQPSATPMPEDKTLFGGHSARQIKERFRLPATHFGVVVDQASKILSLACRLTVTESVADMSELRRQCVTMIRDYQQQLIASQILTTTADMASYSLCALLDEIILNKPWGQNSRWAESSLLSDFHAETWAGTHFFELVDKAQRTNDQQMLTLQYLCLAIGFNGKYRVEERGQEQLETLRDTIYQQICSDLGRINSPFDPGWPDRVVPGNPLAQRLPLWVIFSIAGTALLMVYLVFAYKINEQAQPLYNALSHIAAEPIATNNMGDLEFSKDGQYLKQVLATEITNGIVSLEFFSDRIRLRIGSEEIFASGVALIREDIKPVLMKISRTLEATHGRILVAGHTDDNKIFSAKYPSNWHLSLDRATTVANFLAQHGQLTGRLWPEGRGASEPLSTENNLADKALNRRVEIDIIPQTGVTL